MSLRSVLSLSLFSTFFSPPFFTSLSLSVILSRSSEISPSSFTFYLCRSYFAQIGDPGAGEQADGRYVHFYAPIYAHARTKNNPASSRRIMNTRELAVAGRALPRLIVLRPSIRSFFSYSLTIYNEHLQCPDHIIFKLNRFRTIPSSEFYRSLLRRIRETNGFISPFANDRCVNDVHLILLFDRH